LRFKACNAHPFVALTQRADRRAKPMEHQGKPSMRHRYCLEILARKNVPVAHQVLIVDKYEAQSVPRLMNSKCEERLTKSGAKLASAYQQLGS